MPDLAQASPHLTPRRYALSRVTSPKRWPQATACPRSFVLTGTGVSEEA